MKTEIVKKHTRIKKNGASVVKKHNRTKKGMSSVKTTVPPKVGKIKTELAAAEKPKLNNGKLIACGTACHLKKHSKADHYTAHINGKKSVVHKSAVKFNFQK